MSSTSMLTTWRLTAAVSFEPLSVEQITSSSSTHTLTASATGMQLILSTTRPFDMVLTAGGGVLVVVLIVAGAFGVWGYSFANSNVHN